MPPDEGWAGWARLFEVAETVVAETRLFEVAETVVAETVLREVILGLSTCLNKQQCL